MYAAPVDLKLTNNELKFRVIRKKQTTKHDTIIYNNRENKKTKFKFKIDLE